MRTTMKSPATVALAALALALFPASLHAKVIKVPSKVIQTIQQGVNAAAPGDMVLVLPGTYVCSEVTGWPAAVHIWSDKPGLKLMAAGPVKLVGPGGEERPGTGIWIDADNVTVEGFDISGFGRGIVASGQAQDTQTQVTGNAVQDCTGVCIELRGSGNYEVVNNTVIGGATGIFLAPESAANPRHHIHHNRVTHSKSQGIMVYLAPGSRLDHNVCNNNLWEGIYLAGSPHCTAEHNQTDSNGWAGIEVGGSPNCVVTGNKANNNAGFHPDVNADTGGSYAGWGILVWDSCGSIFERNVAQGNLLWDLFAVDWDPSSPPTCSTCLNNRADTASPSLELWDVKELQ